MHIPNRSEAAHVHRRKWELASAPRRNLKLMRLQAPNRTVSGERNMRRIRKLRKSEEEILKITWHSVELHCWLMIHAKSRREEPFGSYKSGKAKKRKKGNTRNNEEKKEYNQEEGIKVTGGKRREQEKVKIPCDTRKKKQGNKSKADNERNKEKQEGHKRNKHEERTRSRGKKQEKKRNKERRRGNRQQEGIL